MKENEIETNVNSIAETLNVVKPIVEATVQGGELTEEKSQRKQMDGNVAEARQRKPKTDLEKLEIKIRRVITGYSKVGVYLKEIHDRELYKEVGFYDFDTYCKVRLKISGSHAYRMFKHFSICKLIGEDHLEIHERVTRPMVQLEDNEILQLWTAIKKENNGKVPSSMVIAHAVTAYRKEHPRQKVESDSIYVSKHLGYVKKDQLAETLLEKTNGFTDLSSLIKKCSKYLSAEDQKSLTQECQRRLDVFLPKPA